MSKALGMIGLAGLLSGCVTLSDTDRYCFDTASTSLNVGDTLTADTRFGCFMVRPMDGDPVSVVEVGGAPAGRRGLRAARLYFWDYTNNPECRVTNASTVSVTYSATRTGRAVLDINASNGSTMRTADLTLDPRRGTRTLISRGPPILGGRPASVAINDASKSIAVSKVCFIRSGWF